MRALLVAVHRHINRIDWRDVNISMYVLALYCSSIATHRTMTLSFSCIFSCIWKLCEPMKRRLRRAEEGRVGLDLALQLQLACLLEGEGDHVLKLGEHALDDGAIALARERRKVQPARRLEEHGRGAHAVGLPRPRHAATDVDELRAW